MTVEGILYTIFKYVLISRIQSSASVIECIGNDDGSMSSGAPSSSFYTLQFNDELTTSRYDVVLNLILFGIIFKDPIVGIWSSFKDHYNEICAIKILHRNGGLDILEEFKSFELVDDHTILTAVHLYLNKKYDPKSFGFTDRCCVFDSFKSTKKDIIPAIIEFREKYPTKFINIFEAHKLQNIIQISDK